MKKLLITCLILGMLGVCSQSYGYILVYRLSTVLRAVDIDVNELGSVTIRGYLALDLNNVTPATLDDAQMVIYGRDTDANKIYLVQLSGTGINVTWQEYGDYLTVFLRNRHAPFYYDVTLTGRLYSRDVGFGYDDRKNACSSLRGSIASRDGIIFDVNQVLFGSGNMSMTLDTRRTKQANQPPSTVSAVIDMLVTGQYGLVHYGYTALVLP